MMPPSCYSLGICALCNHNESSQYTSISEINDQAKAIDCDVNMEVEKHKRHLATEGQENDLGRWWRSLYKNWVLSAGKQKKITFLRVLQKPAILLLMRRCIWVSVLISQSLHSLCRFYFSVCYWLTVNGLNHWFVLAMRHNSIQKCFCQKWGKRHQAGRSITAEAWRVPQAIF